MAIQSKVKFLFYMDDLKLFARNENDLTLIISTVQLFSSDVCMTISRIKSPRLIVSRGKITDTTGVSIEALGLVSDIDVSDSYKHLGILQDL